MVRQLLETKTNIFGALAIAIVSSGSTVAISKWIDQVEFRQVAATNNSAISISAGTRAVTDCGNHVYSPVQNACVTRSVFDDEMKRLYAALGISTAIFERRATIEQN